MTGLWTPRHGIYTVGSSERGNVKDRKIIPIKIIDRCLVSLKLSPKF